MATEAAMKLRHFKPRPIDPGALAADPLGRNLFSPAEPAADDLDKLTASERAEHLLRSGLAECRELPADQALQRIRDTRRAVKYGDALAPQRVVLSAIEEAVEARARREAQQEMSE